MEAFLPYKGRDSRCSSRSHSTDSSIDIAFLSCSPSLSPDSQSHSRGRSSGCGVYRPDSASVMKPVQRKSKSLNGLQLESIDSHPHPVRSPVHPRLVRQSSAKSRLRNSSPERHHEPNPHTTAEELHKVTQHKPTQCISPKPEAKTVIYLKVYVLSHLRIPDLRYGRSSTGRACLTKVTTPL